ncbi:hypothetical protein [Pseudomonas sp. EA_65y_Pfl2_P78]|uniref:hypothetical protein n=1 Tax=Pseudomonas sp. EA_65y_Pfl2_P78 TaxID=3088695 RepID=UPI0030D8AEB1
MSEKDIQQESNVADFPNTDNANNSKSEQSSQPKQPEKGKPENKTTDDSESAFHDRRLRQIIEEQRVKDELYEISRRKGLENFRRTMFTSCVIITALMILMFVSIRNPTIYKIDEDTLTVVNQALNALILLVIPFLLGIVGAAARILIATVQPELKGNLLISSGLMATFSWIGIKSGVLISIIAPHLEKANIPTDHTINTAHDFYTMALVAIVVGMFSTNLYLVVAEKVEQITQKAQNKNNDSKVSN